jgi:hypothetical protein
MRAVMQVPIFPTPFRIRQAWESAQNSRRLATGIEPKEPDPGSRNGANASAHRDLAPAPTNRLADHKQKAVFPY